MNARRRFGIRSYRLVLGAIGLVLALLAINRPAQAQLVIVIDECQLVDHFFDEEDYPQVDFSQPTFQAALSLGGLGATFDLQYVPEGSQWDVDFSDGTQVSGMVGEMGKTFAYRGLSAYGNYPYTSTLTDPDGSPIEGAPSGTLVVDASEKECSADTLVDSPQLPTNTPTETPFAPTATEALENTATTIPTVTESSTEVNPLAPDALVADETGIYDLPLFGPVDDWIVYLCCLVLIVLLMGGTVVIVVRRRRRRLNTFSNGPSGVDEDLLR